MAGEKFFLWSKGVLGSLGAIGAAVVLLATGQPATPEDVSAVQALGSDALRVAAELVALGGGALALYGRVTARRRLSTSL